MVSQVVSIDEYVLSGESGDNIEHSRADMFKQDRSPAPSQAPAEVLVKPSSLVLNAGWSFPFPPLLAKP